MTSGGVCDHDYGGVWFYHDYGVCVIVRVSLFPSLSYWTFFAFRVAFSLITLSKSELDTWLELEFNRGDR